MKNVVKYILIDCTECCYALIWLTKHLSFYRSRCFDLLLCL